MPSISNKLRLSLTAAATACALVIPTAAHAATTTRTQAGSVVGVTADSVTIQSAGRQTGVINALVASANAITAKDYPYVWGGGHAQAGVASVGIKGPGHNGKRLGLDCSGSVAAVLAGAGLWTPGTSVPADNGVISELLARHVIARGVGAAPGEVTLYDDPGVHIFMSINGRFFGTSDGSGGGNKNGGAGWLDDGAWDAKNPAFKKYHVLPSVLHTSTTYGTDYTFQLSPALLSAGLQLGESVHVSYTEASTGQLQATAISLPGGTTLSGVTPAPAPTPTPAPAPAPTSQSGGIGYGDGVATSYRSGGGGL